MGGVESGTMTTAIQKRTVEVRPQRSIRADRKAVITGVAANVFAALEGLKKLERSRCPQRGRLLAAQEKLEEAKSLVLQIMILDTQQDQAGVT